MTINSLRGTYTILAKLLENLIATVFGKISPNIINTKDTINTSSKIILGLSLIWEVVINTAREPIATLIIVFPVNIETSKLLGFESKSFSFWGTSSWWVFKLNGL